MPERLSITGAMMTIAPPVWAAMAGAAALASPLAPTRTEPVVAPAIVLPVGS